MKRNRRGAGIAFLTIGIAFITVGLSDGGQRSFLYAGLPLLIIGVVLFLRKSGPPQP